MTLRPFFVNLIILQSLPTSFMLILLISISTVQLEDIWLEFEKFLCPLLYMQIGFCTFALDSCLSICSQSDTFAGCSRLRLYFQQKISDLWLSRFLNVFRPQLAINIISDGQLPARNNLDHFTRFLVQQANTLLLRQCEDYGCCYYCRFGCANSLKMHTRLL